MLSLCNHMQSECKVQYTRIPVSGTNRRPEHKVPERRRRRRVRAGPRDAGGQRARDADGARDRGERAAHRAAAQVANAHDGRGHGPSRQRQPAPARGLVGQQCHRDHLWRQRLRCWWLHVTVASWERVSLRWQRRRRNEFRANA